MSGPVTNEEILAYLVDLSANIAEQFRSLERGIIQEFAYTQAEIAAGTADIKNTVTAETDGVKTHLASFIGHHVNDCVGGAKTELNKNIKSVKDAVKVMSPGATSSSFNIK